MRHGYPLVELHRHLDGNVRLETILDLGRQHGLDLPAWTPAELRPHVQVMSTVPDLLGFLAKFDVLRRILVDYDAIRRITRENLEDAVREGIDYIELRFSPYFMAEEHELDPIGVTETICDTIAAATDLPVLARPIVILSRTYGPALAEIELQAALELQPKGVVAIDLAGDEANFPGDLFLDHFERARAAGLRVIAHAGEAAGPGSVWQAVFELQAERIGHGVRASEDPSLLAQLAERRVAIESCPTSNLQTSTVASYAAHPLPEFLRRGLLVSLSTDDPSISGIDLAHEYQVVQDQMGLSAAECRQLQENALATAFLTDGERQELAARASLDA